MVVVVAAGVVVVVVAAGVVVVVAAGVVVVVGEVVVVGTAVVVVVVVVVIDGAAIVVVVGWGTDGCSAAQLGSDDNAVVMLTNKIGTTVIADKRCLDERTHHAATLPAASNKSATTIKVVLRPVAGNKHTSFANI